MIRQDRLTAGLNFLDEVSRQLAQALLTIPDKRGAGCTFEDAQVLANHEGLVLDHSREDSKYNEFVRRAMERS